MAERELVIIGCGPGGEDYLTTAAKREIDSCELILGSGRMLENIKAPNKANAYDFKAVRPYMAEGKYKKIAVLMSGDSGFFSGKRSLCEKISKDAELKYWKITVYAGISSVSYMAAKLKESYDDASVISLHGKEEWKPYVLCEVNYSGRVFMLTSGREQAREIADTVLRCFDNVKVYAGINLSYEDEKILKIKKSEDITDGMCVLFVKNAAPVRKSCGRMLGDGEFIRGNVPMTKQEVRQVSVGKLGLYEGAVLFDLGCGTGSVSVCTALLSPFIKVCAVDRSDEAIRLTKENAQLYRCANIETYCEDISDFLERDDIKQPTHAFIGGSGGKLKEIVNKLKEINPNIIIVVNAVTLETVSCVRELMTDESEAVFMQISRNKKIGGSNMMFAENQIMIARL